MNYRQKILNFIKYNNATVIILAVILVIGGGVLAAGPENIGQKRINIEGLDNTALVSVDLETFNMDFKIENIEQDGQYYYVTYSFLDLVETDNLWQYQLSQKTQKASRKIKEDLGEYMAKFMAKHYEARLRALKQEKSLAESSGEQKRFEITEYSGLIGKTLDLTAVIFPGYEPIKKRQLSTPENFNLPETNFSNPSASSGRADNLEKIYNDYVASHPEIFEILTEPEPTEDATNSPEIAPAPDDTASGTPDSAETPEGKTETSDSELPVEPEIPEVPGIVEPESVDIIELPLPEPTEEIKVPVETPAPAETPTPVEEEVVPAEPTPDETPVPAETPAE